MCIFKLIYFPSADVVEIICVIAVGLGVDGKTVQVATTAGSQLRASAESNFLQPGQRIVAVHNGQPAEGRRFTARIAIEPIMSESDTRVSAHQTTESSVAFELTD